MASSGFVGVHNQKLAALALVLPRHIAIGLSQGVEVTSPPLATMSCSLWRTAIVVGYVMVNLCNASTRLVNCMLNVSTFG